MTRDDALLRAPAPLQLDPLVRRALEEDLGLGDLTTSSTIPAAARASASLIARQDGIVAGIGVAARTFTLVDAELRAEPRVADGAAVTAGTELLTVEGRAASILGGERVALNFLQRLSGIATLTSRYVAAVSGTGARIVDTRKTMPGLRLLERYAVRCGGGANHRWNLGDAVLIKDNHRAVLAASGISLADAITRARANLPHTTFVEVEIDEIDELDAVLHAGPDAVLLDNLAPAQMAEAVRRGGGRVIFEASGGVTLDAVRSIAESGVDLISVGALTHSAPAFDAAVDFSSMR
jgi:nicotinate-nucleotide pyrophosphorylase (carboxylating)